MTDREHRKALIQHKRKQRDRLLKKIILAACSGIIVAAFPMMVLIYIRMPGPF